MGQIIKSKLANGVFWVEFPDADLRILCGCPADSVKHMMKRGMIRRDDAAPVFCESGPNAILLSDLSVQKGSFSNLGEFPVLQMLYRQGMILPDHPGNTGVKPLLIGHPDQLVAQIQYIYRGNYGLVSEDEIIKAGTSPERAKELMRLKLKFAFGKIADPKDLLDSIAVENGDTPIQNGVTVRRTDINVFEFSYKGQQVSIDLNLESGEIYMPSYTLGHFQVAREYFSVIHSGEGDGWDIERPSMASILSFQGKIYLIDVGPNIDTTLKLLGIDISEVEGIFMTHCHDDHFAGLPSLIRSDHRIKFYATPLVRHATVKKLSALMGLDESRFERFFCVRNLEEGEWNDVAGLEVKPVHSPHPMETTILFFRTQWGDGYKSYGHLADIASFDVLDAMVTDDDSAPGISAEECATIKQAYLEPCTLKKVDKGGGMIHGRARDFTEDTSQKIIFAHTARPLNERERLVGSGAPFGTQDVLIPSNHDLLFGRAYNALQSFFPDLPASQFRLLLNHEIVTFNPEDILLKAGEEVRSVYFILSGTAEILEPDSHITHRLSAGSFVGDMPGLNGQKAGETYRAISFLKVLKLPTKMYVEFIKRNQSFTTVAQLAQKREFLQKSWLFGGSISDGVKNSIASAMRFVENPESLNNYDNVRNDIALITHGHVTRKLGPDAIETLEPGDALLEDHAVYKMKSIFTLEFSDDVQIALIPVETIREIPIVQWKLLETLSRQMRVLSNATKWDNSLLNWQDAYLIGIPEIDRQHKILLSLTQKLVQAIQEKESAEVIDDILEELIKYTSAHFSREENIFLEGGYCETTSHMDTHAKLLGQVAQIRERNLQNLSPEENDDLFNFLKHWVLTHILLEDRKYASYIFDIQNSNH